MPLRVKHNDQKKKSVITLETVSECLEFCNSDIDQRRRGAAITLPTDFFKPKEDSMKT